MANEPFEIPHRDKKNPSRWTFWKCATAAGMPASGFNESDVFYAEDTNRFSVADSSTTRKSIVSGERSEWIPASVFTEHDGAALSFTGTYPNRYAYHSMSPNAQTKLLAFWRIPTDYAAIAGWDIVYDQPTIEAGQTVWNLYIAGIGAGNFGTLAYIASAENIVSGPVGVTSVSMGALNAGAAGQVVRIALDREYNHASDTNSEAMHFIGLNFRYTV